VSDTRPAQAGLRRGVHGRIGARVAGLRSGADGAFDLIEVLGAVSRPRQPKWAILGNDLLDHAWARPRERLVSRHRAREAGSITSLSIAPQRVARRGEALSVSLRARFGFLE
jgi:hypothetical protein